MGFASIEDVTKYKLYKIYKLNKIFINTNNNFIKGNKKLINDKEVN